jgi:Kef-type K+ transport system membrane component KefB
MNERHGSAAKVAVFFAPMQWLTLALTFVVWAVLQKLARTGPVEARATLALGLLAFAAYLAGTIAQRARVPRIVGFLLVGFIAGPAWLGFVRRDELELLTTVANGALALIAFAAGSELTLDVLRRPQRRATIRIVAGAMGVPFIAVTLVALTVSAWFPLTAHQPVEDALTVALTLGVLATVSAPALTWAVITDVQARGRLASTVRDVSMLQALAAVVAFVMVLALAGPLASAGATTPGVAIHALLVLGGSLAAGAALGVAAAQYLRAISGRLDWVLLVFGFIVAQAARLAGLDAVLVALAAGFTLRNVAPAREQSERARSELARSALPVYVVFFALAGSNLRLTALADIWPWLLLFVGLRATGLWAGLRWAGRHGSIAPEPVDYGWLGLISQGGLAITLAAVARRAFPEWNVSLEALVLAMVGVHQLAGPICFHWALRRTGEAPGPNGEGAGGAHGRESAEVGDAAHRGAGGMVASGSSVY